MIEKVEEILNKNWNDYDNDRRDLERWVLFWSILVMICAILAFFFNKFIAIAECILVPVLIANIRESGKIRRDREKLMNASEQLLKGAREQFLIQAMLRREKLSETLKE